MDDRAVPAPLPPIRVVAVDTMTFAYLLALQRLELVRAMGLRTRKLVVTKAVLRQLRRSARLGPPVQSYCNRGELTLISPLATADVSLAVSSVVGTPASNLVRRNRADSELIEVAAFEDGAVLSGERGIVALAERREVPVIDLLTFLVWAVHCGVTTAADVEACTAPWATPAGAAAGAPADFEETFSATAAERGAALAQALEALQA